MNHTDHTPANAVGTPATPPQPHYDQTTPAPVDTYSPIEAAEAEVAVEVARGELPEGYVMTQLSGEVDGVTETRDVAALVPGRWRASTMQKLNTGDLNGFMEDVLHPDYLADFLELDPTQDQFNDFSLDLADTARESLGKSSGRRRSSRRTSRR